MRFFSVGITLLLSIIIYFSVLQVAAVPPLPAEYYGNVLVDGSPAPAGTVVTALFQNDTRGQVITEIDGFYGGPGLFDPRLKVNITEEELLSGNLFISFRINDLQASETILFEPGSSQQVDISTGSGSVQMMDPGSTPIPVQTAPQFQELPADNNTQGNYPAPLDDNDSSPSYSDTTENTPSIRYGLDSEEQFISDDGMASVNFQQDTLLFAPSGQFLQNITIVSRNITDIPPVDKNQSVIFTGYAYEILPERTYFNPEGILSFHVPIDHVSELMKLNPQIFEYYPQTASWIEIKTTSNQFTSEISGQIYEAGVYALFIDAIPDTLPEPPEDQNQTPGPLAPIAGGQASAPAYQHDQPQGMQQVMNQEPMPPQLPPEVPPMIQITETPEQIVPVNTTPEVTYSPTSVSTLETPESEPTPVETATVAPPAPSDPLSSLKKGFSAPIIITIILVIFIILMNAIVYLVYTRWWLVRNP